MTGSVPRFSPGVRFREARNAQSATLLVPEGIVELNESAAAVLSLVDGVRDVNAIVAALAERFDDRDGTAARDVRELIDAFERLGFLA